MSTLNQNQFKQSRVLGEPDLTLNPTPNVYSVRFNPEATVDTDFLTPGEGVKLVDLAGNDVNGVPIVDERAADADAIFGVKIFDTKNGSNDPSDIVQVAGKDAVIWMNAGAAIARGAKVALVLATPGNVVTQTTEALFGLALDKATAADQLIRVQVKAEGYV